MIKTKPDTVVKERPRAAVKAGASGGREPPVPPGAVLVGDGGGGVTLLVRGLPSDIGKRLDAERARRGMRSRNDVAVAVLDKGVPK